MSNKKFSGKYAALVLALVAAAGSLTYYLTQRGGGAAEEAATVRWLFTGRNMWRPAAPTAATAVMAAA